ncbi:hypothetical protein OG453_41345 [Streptomyces sp. NBC_01381]|uniref:hypothetical protein n=1 Tax=Streptomyces sp. NBC_01381 TaxID=2903845 RepID=UPI002257E2AC|nr:hypothetical protein [Streptomyces sp. NBC_01381]MCX4673010.1 hypothetical protein [Streptomyces sp. NBC_01381]
MLYVVTGPPAAGKSSWIEAHATARDVVIDLDRITVALSGPGAPQWNQHELHLRIAQGDAYDASSGLHYGATAVYNTGNGGCVKTFVASQGTAAPVLDSVAPFTWAASDILYASGRYEAAS